MGPKAAQKMVDAHWYALHVHSQHERLVADAIAAEGFESFFPSYTERVKWSDRTKTVERPLFPGYLFARFDREAATVHRMLTMRGVVRILGDFEGPIAIPAEDVEAIQRLIASGARIRVEVGTHHQFQPGERVAVMRGPFRGEEGIVSRTKKKRVVVWMALLNRTVHAELDADSIRLEAKAA